MVVYSREASWAGGDRKEETILVICEGPSANTVFADDFKNHPNRFGFIHGIANPENDFFDQLDIMLTDRNTRMIRYGKLYICTDSDTDGNFIAITIIQRIIVLAVDYLQQERMWKLFFPLYKIITTTESNLRFHSNFQYVNWASTNFHLVIARQYLKGAASSVAKIDRTEGSIYMKQIASTDFEIFNISNRSIDTIRKISEEFEREKDKSKSVGQFASDRRTVRTWKSNSSAK